MGMRELLILLLGLAIVAVILRGLYVALQARRGQIRLAIDKNIPTDVDLDALEMAELPGGGARVIPRDSAGRQQQDEDPEDPVEQANERAHALDLGHDDEAVPVLMDSVQVEPSSEQSAGAEQDTDESATSHTFDQARTGAAEANWVDDDYDEPDAMRGEQAIRDEPAIAGYADDDEYESDGYSGELSPEDEFEVKTAGRRSAEDGLASVQPDYPEADEDTAIASHDEEESDLDYDEYGDDYEDGADDLDQGARAEPTLSIDAEDDLDDFSMTAGERIGGQQHAALGGNRKGEQKSAEFADDSAVPVKRKSLFSALRGRFRSKIGSLKDLQKEDAIIDDMPSEQDPDLPELTDYVAQDLVAQEAFPSASEPELKQPTQQLDIETALESENQPGKAKEAEHDEVPVEAVPKPRRESVAAQEPQSRKAEHRAHSNVAQKSEVREQDKASQSSEVIVLNVMAAEGREFRGEDLIHTIIASGLKFGDMQIFHHRFGKGSNGPVIFSLANILNPGTFDLNNMAQFSTIGVSLFMAMPTPINNLDAFEQMLAVAQQLCATLDGDLKDDHRNVMTAQTIEHYRQRIRDFELRQLKTAGSRG